MRDGGDGYGLKFHDDERSFTMGHEDLETVTVMGQIIIFTVLINNKNNFKNFISIKKYCRLRLL
jgi:hypothetical protein